MWDGFVSNLRTYSVEELQHMVRHLHDPGYRWQVDKIRSIGLSRVTYLIGSPMA